ncbi:hypothetical protein TSTA_108340 [Talaromyces stipitatus ATCC 10500]|uniref:Uncharacterized protein n=1 Tax=Talaromyces stipitatus (strain ATCC 10500 / CBS 375.48 / QM 6759 / NRRL 1006) TaxID=441959 RepID=B8MUE2_TALSN|nr:uncharacterized protein TSTA_108340 [Talaromyces stipitatus ATCC 10500]EED11646.1 hypothetical protein TSTA_108340 [Talaromyces stipitatus ATCC 10500]
MLNGALKDLHREIKPPDRIHILNEILREIVKIGEIPGAETCESCVIQAPSISPNAGETIAPRQAEKSSGMQKSIATLQRLAKIIQGQQRDIKFLKMNMAQLIGVQTSPHNTLATDLEQSNESSKQHQRQHVDPQSESQTDLQGLSVTSPYRYHHGTTDLYNYDSGYTLNCFPGAERPNRQLTTGPVSLRHNSFVQILPHPDGLKQLDTGRRERGSHNPWAEEKYTFIETLRTHGVSWPIVKTAFQEKYRENCSVESLQMRLLRRVRGNKGNQKNARTLASNKKR